MRHLDEQLLHQGLYMHAKNTTFIYTVQHSVNNHYSLYNKLYTAKSYITPLLATPIHSIPELSTQKSTSYYQQKVADVNSKIFNSSYSRYRTSQARRANMFEGNQSSNELSRSWRVQSQTDLALYSVIERSFLNANSTRPSPPPAVNQSFQSQSFC